MVRLPPRLRPLFPYLRPAYVRATGAIAPFSTWLSRRRDTALPQGFVDTLAEAAARTGGRCVVARDAEMIIRPPMRGTPPDLPLTDIRLGETFATVSVAELPHGRVLGKHRAVITRDGELVDEVSRYFDTAHGRQHPLFLNPFPPPPECIEGRLGVLAVRGDWMYYHFLVDALPRVGVLEQSGIAAPPRWYAPTRARFQRELLELAGIARERIVDADEHPHVQADELVVPGWPAETQLNPPWVVGYLRTRLMHSAGVTEATPHRRIYVTRGATAHNRSVRNEDAILDLLGQRGFEPVDPGTLPVAEQIRTFAEAEIVIAPHGAALANLVFASPGARVIELFPAGSLLPDYWRLACGVPGLEYRYLSAPGGRMRQTRQTTIVRDIEVDVTALRTLIDEAG